ncbi:trypsin-like serine protease [Vibrio mediterranei]|uniref:trypsin-like serine protease n=1 Tax=Vibrio mediterranei TaxID=689 RepID=UPI001EFD534F|nr:trypsin-like serine protease [Vibrio mediterranei]MCG9625419.1 trypsin-like serine protease [Vibrio mediterranei]
MKKVLFPLLCSVLSANALAADGTPLNWGDYDDLVEAYCTGTLIAGRYVLTAAHCNDKGRILFSDDTRQFAIARNDHPQYSSQDGYDVSIWTLAEPRQTTDIHFLADLTQDTLRDGDTLHALGFGGTTSLTQATLTVDGSYKNVNSPMLIKTIGINNNGTEEGDSGGPQLDRDNKIVALTNAGVGDVSLTGETTDYTIAVNLHYAKDFILDTINGWHYPTVVKGTGTQTITVQSLHVNPTADEARTDDGGNVTLIGGTCYGNNAINPFETCTYQVEANGSGTLYLSDSETISINPRTPQPPSSGSNGNNVNSGGGSGGGGSLGLWSGMALFGLGLRRRLKRG